MLPSWRSKLVERCAETVTMAIFLSPFRVSWSVQRVVNERIVRGSVQINSASLIFISHVTRESVCSLTVETFRQRPWYSKETGNYQHADIWCLSLLSVLLTQYICSLLGALKWKHSLFLFFKTALPIVLLQLTLICCYSRCYSLWPPAMERNYSLFIIPPSAARKHLVGTTAPTFELCVC